MKDISPATSSSRATEAGSRSAHVRPVVYSTREVALQLPRELAIPIDGDNGRCARRSNTSVNPPVEAPHQTPRSGTLRHAHRVLLAVGTRDTYSDRPILRRRSYAGPILSGLDDLSDDAPILDHHVRQWHGDFARPRRTQFESILRNFAAPSLPEAVSGERDCRSARRRQGPPWSRLDCTGVSAKGHS